MPLEVSVKGFKKCCISNATDGTNDDMLWNDGKGDENVSSECEEGEGTDFENGDSDTNL
jgi:hypothetical protein